jgi:DNA repair protein RadC
MKPLTNISEINVSYKPVADWKLQPTVKSSVDAYKVLKEFYSTDTIAMVERFNVLYLSNSNRVTGVYKLSKGGITGTIADIRLILGTALKTLATGIILSHNHPSGNLCPSVADKELTQRLHKAAKLMDLKILDHLILSPEEGQYYSFADKGEL